MSKQKKSPLMFILCALAVTVMISSVLIFQYFNTKQVKQQVYDTLQSSLAGQRSVFLASIDSDLDTLQTFAYAAPVGEASISEKISILRDTYGYDRVGCAATNGQAIFDDSSVTDISETKGFQAATAGKEIVYKNDDGDIVLSVSSVRVDGTISGAVLGIYKEQHFTDMIAAGPYDGNAYSFVVSAGGDVIIRSGNENYELGNSNIFEHLKKTKLSDKDYNTIYNNLQDNVGGIIHYTSNGVSKYAVYEPIGINDWFLVEEVPASVAEQQLSTVTLGGAIAIASVFIGALALIFVTLLNEARSHKILNKEKEQLSVEQERFSLVYDNTSVSMWDFDIKKRCIFQTAHSLERHGFSSVIENVPQSMIDSGYIHPESIKAYTEMYEKILGGYKSASGVFRVKTADGKGWWYEHIRYTNLFDENGHPYRAIGMSEDVTELRQKEIAFEKWQQTKAETAVNSALIEYNLTNDTCENQEGKNIELFSDNTVTSFNDRTDEWAQKHVHPDDRSAFCEILRREYLTNRFFTGKNSVELQFRLIDGECELWYALEVQMIQYPGTNDINAVITFTDIDEEKRTAIDIKERSETDPLTGAFNRSTAIVAINSAIAREPDLRHSLIMLDLDGFKKVNDTYGHGLGDRVLCDITSKLSSLLHENDVLGRIGGDEFVVLLANVPFDDMIEHRAALICKMINIELDRDISVTASLGIAIYPRDGLNFSELYNHADIALYNAKDAGRNRYVFYKKGMVSSLRETKDPDIQLDSTEESSGAVDIIAQNRELLEKQKLFDSYRSIMVLTDSMLYDYNFASESVFVTDNLNNYIISEVSGITPTGDTLRPAVHPADWIYFKAHALDALFGDEGITNIESTVRLKKKAGGYSRFRMTGICRRDEEGRPSELTLMFNQADYTRDHSELLLNLVLDASKNDIILIVEAISEGGYNILYHHPKTMHFTPDQLITCINESYREQFVARTKEVIENNELLEMILPVLSVERGEPGYRHIRLMRIPYEGRDNPVISVIVRDVTAMQTARLQSIGISELLSLSFGENEKMLPWRVNLDTRSIFLVNNSIDGKIEHEYPNMPEDAITARNIHPDSEAKFREFFNNMFSGVPDFTTVVRMKHSDAGFVWSKLTYRLVYDDNGVVCSAVGYTQILPGAATEKNRFDRENKFYSLFSDDMFCAVKINLTEGYIVNGHIGNEIRMTGNEGLTYEDCFKNEFEMIANDADKVLFAKQFSPSAIMRVFENGGNEITAEYRHRSDDGKIIWVCNTSVLLTEPVSGDLYMFIYIRNVDVRKKWELSLSERAEYDSDLKLYSYHTTKKLCETVINTSLNRNSLCGLSVSEFSRLDSLRETFGGSLNAVLCNTIRFIRLMLDDRCIIGTAHDNKLIVFAPNIPSRDFLLENVRHLLTVNTDLARAADMNEDLGCTVGLTYSTPDGFDFNTALDDAMVALDNCHATDESLSLYSSKENKDKADSSNPNYNPLDMNGANSDVLSDAMTGARNRRAYNKALFELDHEVVNSLGVISADVNAIRQINSEYGLSYGDELIGFIVSALIDSFGAEAVYRISGDEFVVLCRNITNDVFTEKYKAVRALVNEKYPDRLSAGFTWADNNVNPNRMINHAESIRTLEKENYYRHQEDSGKLARPKRLKELLMMIARGWFKVYLQPKANLETGEICGAEALIRLEHPEQGIIPPIKYIHQYEEENMIRHIDLFVLSQVIEVLNRLTKEGKRIIPVSVNFSRRTLIDPSVMSDILKMESRFKVPTNLIEIEITESIGDLERETVSSACKRLSSLGFRLSLDDFGSEYSGMAVLSSVHFDTVKLDKTLVDDIVSKDASRIIAKNTINMCQELNIDCIAEGVETEQQVELLRSLGCPVAQGFYYNKPIPIEDFIEKYVDDTK